MKTSKCNVTPPKAAPAIVGAAVLLGGTALGSRVLGLIRDRMLAGTFGAGVELDVYYAAFRIPDLIFTFLVLGALSAGFIPLFTKHLCKEEDSEAAWTFTNNILHILGVCLIGLSVLAIIFTPWILRLVAPGFDAETLVHATKVSRIMYISTTLLGLSSVFGGVLQGLKRFTLYAIAPLMYNIGIILGVLVAQWTTGSISIVAWGVVLGAALHLLIQLFGSARAGWRYNFVWNWKDKDAREMMQMMLPRLLGLAVSQINLIVMTAIASLLAIGSITIFNFANNIQFVPIGIVGISFAIAAFPTMSELANKKNKKKLKQVVSRTARNILFLIVPLSVVFLALRAQIVRVVLGAGVFGWNETIITANVLGFFVISLFAQALIPLLVRVFFAYKNTTIPAVIALISAAINIVLAIMWSRTMGVPGIALAFSVANVIQMVLLWAAANKKLGGMDEVRVLKSSITIVGSAIMCGIVVQAMKELFAAAVPLTTFFAVLGQGLVAGIAGFLVYLIVSWVFKSEELDVLVAGLKRKLFRKSFISESADEAVESNF
ncbi:murein biosynthesis integral membrane protein MurJ [Candidatus Uhrbacteria bacterium]|nr:murein biosynthesis integral membrane protein MurJ [Candidatus Uhrbacteria bacterium]